jgi:hypothetical protein
VKNSLYCSPASHEFVSKPPIRRKNVIPAFGLVEKGIDFNVTWNAFIKKHESILQRSQAFRGSA